MTKYIFVTGGVLSGLGKGTIAASIGMLLKNSGLRVTAIKIDPYLNVDAGTMSPYAHGEVFVTEDGGETDMDIGHYERFLHVNLSKRNNITSGQIYYSVITKERRGEYLGKCVQIIPHVTDEIKSTIRAIARNASADVAIVEIGGTVGDIEGLPFLEAARQMRFEEGSKSVFYVHVALAPILPSGELKTKPIQHSVQELRRIGIQPDAIVARSSAPLDEEARGKIALYGNVPREGVFSAPFLDTPYKIPLVLYEQGLVKYMLERLGLPPREPDLSAWRQFVEKLDSRQRACRIAMIGKYTKLKDSYVSIIEALTHASAWLGVKPILEWFEPTEIENNPELLNKLEDVDGAIILPGFGERGTEGKIKAIKYLRESKKPVLGICFGMQLMAVEAARNIVGLEEANSQELEPNTPHPVVILAPGRNSEQGYGGTLILGARKIIVEPGTLAWEIYQAREVYERHRHRYIVNPKYVDILEKAGLKISGYSEEGYPEFLELRDGPFYFGTQAHPEFSSKPLSPSRVYYYFLKTVARL